jgi:hypothetical protein
VTMASRSSRAAGQRVVTNVASSLPAEPQATVIRYWRCDTNKPNRARSGGRLDRQGADYCRHEQRERKGPQGITPFLPTTRRGYASSGHPINGRSLSLETERPFGPPYGHTAAPEPRKAAPAQRMIDSREANNVVDA